MGCTVGCTPAGSSVLRFSRQAYCFLLQGLFLAQGWNPRLLQLLHWQGGHCRLLLHAQSSFPKCPSVVFSKRILSNIPSSISLSGLLPSGTMPRSSLAFLILESFEDDEFVILLYVPRFGLASCFLLM